MPTSQTNPAPAPTSAQVPNPVAETSPSSMETSDPFAEALQESN
jgi:hypothetical protein